MCLSHQVAVSVEHIVTNSLKCDSGAYAGLVSADRYAKSPIEAALAIIYKFYREDCCEYVDEFICRWEEIFDKEGIVEDFIGKMYADELSGLTSLLVSGK